MEEDWIEYEYITFEDASHLRKLFNYFGLWIGCSVLIFLLLLPIGIIAGFSPTLISILFAKGKDPIVIKDWQDVAFAYFCSLVIAPFPAVKNRYLLEYYWI